MDKIKTSLTPLTVAECCKALPLRVEINEKPEDPKIPSHLGKPLNAWFGKSFSGYRGSFLIGRSLPGSFILVHLNA